MRVLLLLLLQNADVLMTSGKRTAHAPHARLHGSETILVAEDEPGVRKLVCETLEQLGYTVLQAADGLEALRVLEEPHRSVDVLLTDVMMPVMGGPELANTSGPWRPAPR